jgi:hypothetical protein
MNSCPALADQYRQNTEKQKAMAGVSTPSFKCKKCGAFRQQPGRKLLVAGARKYGYICAECVAA